MSQTLTVTELVCNFADYVSRVVYRGERFRLTRGGRPVAGRENDDFFLSVLTVSELLHGVYRAKSQQRRARRSAYVEAIIARFPLLNVDVAAARSHARLFADLASRTGLIRPHDLWLGAVCLAHGLAIATANVLEFERVPGLVVET